MLFAAWKQDDNDRADNNGGDW